MSLPLRYLLIAIGSVSLGLGVLGVFLPVLPTTPFLLLAAACFVRASDRLYGWLLRHPLFGCYIRDYHAGLGVPMRVKALALAMVWTSIPASIALMYLRLGASPLWIATASVLLCCAAFATWFLLVKLPTRSPDTCSAAVAAPIGEE